MVGLCTGHEFAVESGARSVLTRRKLQTPGTAQEHKRQETPTINPIGPTDTPRRPSTKHYRKESPGDAQQQLTQQPCTIQHNNPPSAPTPDRVVTGSFQPTQPAAKPRSNTGGLVEQAGWLRRRAEPHNIDTTRLSGDTQRPPAPPAWGGPSSRVADG